MSEEMLLAESEKRYLEYIKMDFRDRKKLMSQGYKNYLMSLIFTSEIRLRSRTSHEIKLNSLMDVISFEILKNKGTNVNSKIYKKLAKQENMYFGQCKLYYYFRYF